MMLSDIRDYVATLGMADTVYMAKMDPKPDRVVGVYRSKHQYGYTVPIGGAHLASYGAYYATILIHWTKSPRETETATKRLFDALVKTRNATINEEKILFVQPLYDLQDVGTDDAGVCEMVIEAAFIYAKKGDN